MRIADAPGAVPHEALNRLTPDYATPEALAAQRAAFLARGGRIQQLPAGASAEVHKIMPSEKQRRRVESSKRGSRASALAKKAGEV